MASVKKNEEVPFLYYVKDGVCKSNAEMPTSSESFRGWFSASHVLRNPHKHSKKNVKAAKASLKSFVESIKRNNEKKNGKTQTIKEKDLLKLA